MKRWFLLVLEIAVSNVSARKLLDFSSPHRPGLDLDGMEAMVLQLGSQSSPEKLKPLFDDFRKLLQKELLPRLHQEQGTANSLLEDAAKGFALCKGVDSSRILALVTEHKQCRADEFDDQIIQSRACNSSKHLAQVQQQNCKAFEDVDIYPEEVPKVCNKGTNDTSHEAHAKRVRDFYASKVQAFLNAQQLCENTTADASFLKRSCDGTTRNLEMKSQECLRIQRSLDDLACEAWTALYACEERNSCLSQARHRYLDANRTGVSTEADLMSQWRAVKRIECFLDAMEKNTTVQECRRQSIDGSPMALSYPFFQDKAPMMPNTSGCEKPKFPQPGSVDYSKKVYELGTRSALPATCTAECCSRCEFFTCNGSTVLKPGAKIRPGFSQEICCHLPPKAQWKADDWPKAVCSTECGLHEVYETRKVVCWDAANQAEMDEELCGSLTKPSLKRLRCAATSSCRTCQAKMCPAKYVAKVHPPSTCKGLKCTVEECCNRRCSEEDCPVGFGLKSPAPMCTSVHNCTVIGCCGPTRWIYAEWSDATCDKSCGLPEVIENRSVHCVVNPLKDSVAKEQCKGSMPATSRVQCPATTPCVTWVYPPWADETIDCAAAKRGCGLRELVEERPVECKDQRSQIILPDNECTGIKPSSRRVICPSTPECKGTETLTTTLASTAVTTAVTTAAPATTMQAAKVGSWVAPAWSKPDCSQRCCGLGELKEERAVLCMDCNGQLLPECSCAGPKPLTSTVLCPATSPCGSPLATTALATTSTMSTTAAPTTAPVTTTTQASPSPVWVYTAWMTDKSNCEARSCGQGMEGLTEKQLDIGPARPPMVEVQKTFASDDDEGPVFNVTLSRSHGLLGISVDRSDTNCVVIRDVTGGAAASWNYTMPTKEIRTFDQVLEVNGDPINGDDIARKLETEAQEIILKLRRPEERKVVLEKPGRLGIDVNYRKTSVKPWVASISPGLVADWNKDNPDLAVLPHDRIIAVNEVAGNIDMILEKLRSPDKKLVLTCIHYEVI